MKNTFSCLLALIIAVSARAGSEENINYTRNSEGDQNQSETRGVLDNAASADLDKNLCLIFNSNCVAEENKIQCSSSIKKIVAAAMLLRFANRIGTPVLISLQGTGAAYSKRKKT